MTYRVLFFRKVFRPVSAVFFLLVMATAPVVLAAAESGAGKSRASRNESVSNSRLRALPPFSVGAFFLLEAVVAAGVILLLVIRQNRAENKLRKRAARYRGLVQTILDPIVLFDPAARPLFANLAAEEWLGLSRDRCDGNQSLAALGLPRGLLRVWEEQVGAVVRNARSLRVEFEMETQFGARVFDWQLNPELSSSGEVAAVLTVARDITDRKRTDAAIQAVFRKTSTAAGLDYLKLLVRELASILHMRYAFAARLDPARPGHLQTLAFCAAGQITADLAFSAEGTPCEVILKDGFQCFSQSVQARFPRAKLLVEMQAEAYLGVPLVAADGRTLGVLAAAHDRPVLGNNSLARQVLSLFATLAAVEIERLETEAGLRSAQKMEAVGLLAGGVAHDFNNLLGGIFGNLELARNRAAAGDLARCMDLLDEALEVSRRARELSRQLMDFARGGEPVKQVVDLAGLLRETVRFALSGANVRAEFELPETLWPCEVDATQMGQAVGNLVINAKQVMPGGGTLTVRAHNVAAGDTAPFPLSPGPAVRVMFQDTGPGIAPEFLPHIFDPFFTTKPGSCGLGLATASSILRKHGGLITADSVPGGGAIFTLHLPARPGAVPVARTTGGAVTETAPAVMPAAGPAPAGTGPGVKPRARILVMDDEAYLLVMLRKMLDSLGCEIETAESGERAVTVLEQALAGGRRFDAAILDLTIPGGMGGRDTVLALRKLDPGLRAIATSGYSGDPVVVDPAGHGFQAVLLKPYNLQELNAALETVLGPVAS